MALADCHCSLLPASLREGTLEAGWLLEDLLSTRTVVVQTLRYILIQYCTACMNESQLKIVKVALILT